LQGCIANAAYIRANRCAFNSPFNLVMRDQMRRGLQHWICLYARL